MKINGIGGSGAAQGQIGKPQGTDAVSRSLQKQITNVQKEIQELSADKNLTMEEKMKKRQELQQRLAELNRELQQHQIDLRRERQQEQKAKNSQNGKQKAEIEETGNGLSKSGMKALISADSSMKQAQVYEGVASDLKGAARTLRSDIALDERRGQDVSKKKTQLAKVEERIEKAVSSQVDTLKEADKTLQEARKEEREEAVHGQKKEKEEAVSGQKEEKEEAVSGQKEEQKGVLSQTEKPEQQKGVLSQTEKPERQKEDENDKLPGKSVDLYL